MIVSQKPAYWITVRDNFWNFLLKEQGIAREYEKDIYQAPVVKSIGLTKTVAAGDIYASGIVYDTTQRVSGGEIALGAVALDRELLDKAAGCLVEGGFSYDNTQDIGTEFGFGYYLDESDGNKVYYWHPRCKLVPSDESVETSTDAAIDPQRDYTVKCMPTSEGIWRIRYYTRGVAEPLSVEEFFSYCRYTSNIQAVDVTITAPKVSTACTATIVYADDAEPVSPTVIYQWYQGETADGAFTAISDATSDSYTPDAEMANKYIQCEAIISGSAVGYVVSDPQMVTSA